MPTVLTSNPDTVITFTVNNYVSVTQGTMSTSASPPDVVTALVSNTSGRVTRVSNGSFTVSGSAPGGNPIVLKFEVLPEGVYSLEGVIIKNVNNINEGGVPWDQVIIGSGANDNKVTLRDFARKPSTDPVDYRIYLLICPKQNPQGFPVGDFGLIDPLWSNQ
jgi:hypothetical protein